MDKNSVPTTGTSEFTWKHGPLATIGVMVMVFALFALGTMVGEIGGLLIFSPDPATLHNLNNPTTATISIGAYVVGSLFPLAYLKWLIGAQPVMSFVRGRWSDIKGRVGKTILLGVLGYIAVQLLTVLYLQLPVPEPHVPASDEAKHMSGAALLIFSLGATICGPLFEEITDRGFAYTLFLKAFSSRGFSPAVTTIMATVLSATFFAGMHLTLSAFVPLFIFGVVAAEVYRRSGNIYASMVMHFLFNGITSLVLLLELFAH